MEKCVKKVLVLGSDFGTYDLVVEAKKMGLYVIVADYLQTTQTKEVSDEAWCISTTDLDVLEQKIIQEKISALIVGASEFNMENCRALCQRLHMPLYCSNARGWQMARNKGLFKKHCISAGVPVAEDYYLTDSLSEEELSAVHYPVVVKPVDMSANRGVSFCSTKDELIAAYRLARNLSSDPQIIVERQLFGPEYTAYYVLADGHAELSFITSSHHQPGELSNLYTVENVTSHHLDQYLEEVDKPMREMLQEGGCTDGIVWVQFMYDSDGKFYAIEMGYRFAATVVYPVQDRISGFNTCRWMIECALGQHHVEDQIPRQRPHHKEYVASYCLFTNCEGVIDKVEGLDVLRTLPDVVLDFPKREGDKVRYHAMIGIIRIYGKDCDAVCEIIDKVNRSLFIRNSDGENMFIKYTDFDALREEYEQSL